MFVFYTLGRISNFNNIDTLTNQGGIGKIQQATRGVVLVLEKFAVSWIFLLADKKSNYSCRDHQTLTRTVQVKYEYLGGAQHTTRFLFVLLRWAVPQGLRE